MQEGYSFFTSLLTFSSWPCQWVWYVNSKVNQPYIYTHVCSVYKLCLTLCCPTRVACQAPLSVGFFRQEYWSGLPFPPQRNLPNPRVEPESVVPPNSLVVLQKLNIESPYNLAFHSKFPAFQAGSLLPTAIREVHTYTYIPWFFGFPSRLGHHRALNRTPCTMQQVLN